MSNDLIPARKVSMPNSGSRVSDHKIVIKSLAMNMSSTSSFLNRELGTEVGSSKAKISNDS